MHATEYVCGYLLLYDYFVTLQHMLVNDMVNT